MGTRKKYILLDDELSFDIPLYVEYDSHNLNWDIPIFNYEDFEYWNDMSKSEQIVYRLIQDPFLWHHYILGYDALAHQGEWLYEFKKNKYLQLLAPTDFGKSTVGTVSYPLWKYFINCNLRVGIISGSEEQTEASLREIELHLEENGKFKEIFKIRWGHDPIPDKRKKWNKSEKLCYRTKPIGARDVTFFGLGLSGAAWGKRIDELILDDFISPKDFVTRNEDLMKSIEVKMEEVLTTRMGSDGQCKSIGTFHAAYDTYNYVINSFWRQVKCLKYRAITRKNLPYRIDISDHKRKELEAKKAGIEFAMTDYLDDGIGASKDGFWFDKLNDEEYYSLCPERWTVSQLQERAGLMSTTAFCKKYQLALGLSSDRDIDPMWIDQCIMLGKDIIVNPDGTNNIEDKFNYIVIGVDLSSGSKRSKRTSIIVVGFTQDGKRIPIWLYNDKIPFPEQKRKIARLWAKYNANYVIVESNAYQLSLIQELKSEPALFASLGLPSNTIPIRAAFTSSNKHDDIMGIPAVAGLLEHGSYIIPSGNQFTRELFRPLENELKTYPGMTTDVVMSLWFTEHYARTYLGYKSKFYYGANATKMQLEPNKLKKNENIPYLKNLLRSQLNANNKTKFKFGSGRKVKRIYKAVPVFGI